MSCERCGADFAGGRYTRFCDPCRAFRRRKKAKWITTPRIDDAIREIYLQHPQAKTRPGVAVLANKLGWPKHAICRRARHLGLARIKETPWSEDEIAIAERFAWMSDERIVLKLKSAGFVRTRTAVHLKVRRMRFKQNTPYFSGTGLANAFGIDIHVISRWIREGKIYAKRRGTERTERNGGDIFMIHENDIRRFCLSHPTEFDLRKVDQVWFMDLMAR